MRFTMDEIDGIVSLLTLRTKEGKLEWERSPIEGESINKSQWFSLTKDPEYIKVSCYLEDCWIIINGTKYRIACEKLCNLCKAIKDSMKPQIIQVFETINDLCGH